MGLVFVKKVKMPLTWTSSGNLWSPQCSLCKEVASCWRELGLGQSNSLDLSQLFGTLNIVFDNTTLVQNQILAVMTCYVCDYLPLLELFAFEDLNVRQPEGRHKVSWAHETPVLEENRFRVEKHRVGWLVYIYIYHISLNETPVLEENNKVL